VAAVGIALVVGCSEPVSAPTSFTPYQAKDQAFRTQQPAGWEMAQSGAQGSGYSSVKFTKGNASIKISADLVGSLLGDIAKNLGRGAGEEDEELAAVAKVHEFGAKQMQDELSGYTEQKAQKTQTPFGDSRQSEFTASTTFGGKLRGYRVTALARDRRISIVCYCPESNWATLKPAFEKVIQGTTP
jgi:hypothetical protein